MKMKLFAIVALAFVFFGCKKEEKLFEVKVDDLYVMKPGNGDVIKDRIYDIYQRYGVAVFFTDTVGTYVVNKDVNGQPQYRTETLDFGWGFTSYNTSNFIIKRITAAKEQHEALDYCEKYLNSISKTLYPFSVLLAREFTIVTTTGESSSLKNGGALNFFRTLVMTDSLLNPDTTAHFKSIVRSILRTRIDDFPDDISMFGAVSKDSWYGGMKFSNLDPRIPDGTSVAVLNVPAIVQSLQLRGFTDEYIENFKTEMRGVCGPFGFVCGNPVSSGAFTPSGVTDDLDGFVSEILNTDKSTFERYWGKYPLVMKKYQILHDLIQVKLGVEI